MTTRENLMGIRVIRAFNRQESEKKTFEKENGSLVQMQVFVGKISALLNPVTYVIVNLAAVAVIWVGQNAPMQASLLRDRSLRL